MIPKSIIITDTGTYNANTDRKPTRERLTIFAAHLLTIGMLFILPEVLTTLGRPFPLPWQLKVGAYAKSGVYILVFYINYFLIIPRALRNRHAALRMVIYNLVVITVALTIIWLICRWMEPYWHTIMPHRGPKPGHRPPPGVSSLLWSMKWMVRDIVMLVLTIALGAALKLGDNWARMQQHSREIIAARREQELSSLKNQLNPHFLFNTLNTIYALIAVSPDTAQKAVHELSSMLRYVLYEDNTEVTIMQETGLVESYVRLMRLRLGESSQVNLAISISKDMEDARIAPLLFVPLIENVFKHGNTGSRADVMEIAIHAHDDLVNCFTSNIIAHATTLDRQSTGGIGLQNLRRRLTLIYGNRASLETSTTPDNRFCASLTIRLRKESDNPTHKAKTLKQ